MLTPELAGSAVPEVASALARLNRLLPLQERQRALAPPLRTLHRAILRGFATSGMPPARDRLAALRRACAWKCVPA
jgi:hypothetical protein